MRVPEIGHGGPRVPVDQQREEVVCVLPDQPADLLVGGFLGNLLLLLGRQIAQEWRNAAWCPGHLENLLAPAFVVRLDRRHRRLDRSGPEHAQGERQDRKRDDQRDQEPAPLPAAQQELDRKEHYGDRPQEPNRAIDITVKDQRDLEEQQPANPSPVARAHAHPEQEIPDQRRPDQHADHRACPPVEQDTCDVSTSKAAVIPTASE